MELALKTKHVFGSLTRHIERYMSNEIIKSNLNISRCVVRSMRFKKQTEERMPGEKQILPFHQSNYYKKSKQNWNSFAFNVRSP